MSKPLQLVLKSVTCDQETFGEWGKDEIYLLAFGVTGGGQRLYCPPTSLGSYGSGDTNRGNFPKTLIDTTVGENETLVALCLWMFERDSGDLADSAESLESDFTIMLGNNLTADAPLNLPAASLNVYAFAQTMVDMHFFLISAASDIFNNDELLRPNFVHLRAALPHPIPGHTDSVSVQMHGQIGIYQLDFDYQFDLQIVSNG